MGSTQTYSKGSDGCVVCPTAPACPDCAADENCVLTALTCDSCPYTYCAKKTSSSISMLSSVDANGMAINSSNATATVKGKTRSHVHVGGLVSGVVVGSVVAFAILLVLYYWRRHKRLGALRVAGKGAENDVVEWDSNASDNDYDLEDLDDDDDDDDDSGEDGGEDDVHAAPPTQTFGRHPLEDIVEEDDDGEESTRPHSQRPGRLEQFKLKPMRPLKAASDAQSIYSSNTIHTKASSNILPIAYIPGVTINQGRLARFGATAQDDTRSHITLGSSILEDQESSIQQPQQLPSRSLSASPPQLQPQLQSQPLDSPTTAIRARPKLVSLSGLARAKSNDSSESDDDSFTVNLDIAVDDPFNDRNEVS